jgi:hypothetical protein
MWWTKLVAGLSWWTRGPLSASSLILPAFLLLAEALWSQLAFLSSAGGEGGAAEAVGPALQVDFSPS